MAKNSGLSQEEIDALLAGSGLDDFDSSYIPDEEEDIFSVDSGPSASQKTTQEKKVPQKTKEKEVVTKLHPNELLGLPNIKLIYDIKMTLTVEIGRTKMDIKDILGLGEGSIVELNKSSDDFVDILVNDMIMAKGTVVTIGDNFGVKITEIIKPEDRFKFLLDWFCPPFLLINQIISYFFNIWTNDYQTIGSEESPNVDVY